MSTMRWPFNPGCHNALYHPLKRLFKAYSVYPQWPTVSDYNQDLIGRPPKNYSGKNIKFIRQSTNKPRSFIQYYEPKIYLTAQVPTRSQHWHDFFNMLVWRLFPQVKAVLNYLQYQEQKQQYELGKFPQQRSALQHVLTHFDESGIIVVSSQQRWVDLLKQHRWYELFVQQRLYMQQYMQFYTFGHGIYEKALQPYIGLTAKGMVMMVEDKFWQLSSEEKLNCIDEQLAKQILLLSQQTHYQKLLAVPVLGIPGWHVANEHSEFYTNTTYFRALTHKV